MWGKRRHSLPSEARAILGKLRAHSWKTDAERTDLLRRFAAIEALKPEDITWMCLDPDGHLRQTGLELLQRFPFDEGAEALFPILASRTETLRRLAMQAIEWLAGPTFVTRIKDFLAHPNPNVVDAALEWLKRNPSEQVLPWLAEALTSPSVAVRRKAFAIVEATSSPKAASLALKALDDNDENLRFRAIQVLMRFPDEGQIEALLRHCRHDSSRIKDAAIATLTPLLARADARWNELILPLLTDLNPKVRQLASRILATQEPLRVADAFLSTFGTIYGPDRERAVSALEELGPNYIQAFLQRDEDPDPNIAMLAASIAVTIESPEVVPHCVRFLEGSEWWLRDRAAQVLAKIRDPRSLPALLKLLSDPESDITAANALGIWGAAEALPALLEAYKKGTKDLRLEILDAFARINDPRIAGLLESITRADPDLLVRDKAVRLLAARNQTESDGGASASNRMFAPIDFAATPDPSIEELLRHARAVGASDLHVAAGVSPHVRIHGRLQPLPAPEMTPERAETLVLPILASTQTEQLRAARQIDFCYKHAEYGRFRTNVFYERKGLKAVFRVVPYDVPNLTDVGLPESVWDVTQYSQGLVLVTGPAGCGKTTTLAALVDHINDRQRSHVITIEDPIEYVHTSREALINQREVPSHSASFAKALRQALREDPDVILVGEMRDLETISLAITASETGHLVLATLHTTTAPATVDRIINAFPPDQQAQIRLMIADSLKAVISQTLLPRRDGAGRVAAFEILRNTPNVAGLIREGKTFQIPTAMQTGAASGMVLLDNALLNLVNEGIIEPRVGYDRAQRKEAFEGLLPAEEVVA